MNIVRTIELNDNNYEDFIKNVDDLLLIDFWAPWCVPCKQLSPVIDEISSELDDVVVCKIDVDASPKAAAAFGIRGVPTIYLVDKGEVIARKVGAQNKDALLNFISQHK